MPTLKYKKLGSLSVSALGLGCVNLSGLYGESVDDAEEILYEAFLKGICFYDTADAYGNGQNERLISSLYRKNSAVRQQIVLSTKCGVVWDKNQSGFNRTDNSPAYIKLACENSLTRLNTDYIDLFYLHRIEGNGERLEESMSALADLIQEGKIRHIGLSEVSEPILRRAHSVYPITAIQSEYSLMTRNPEINGILLACKELSIGFVAYSPLCRGLLSTHFDLSTLSDDDFRHHLPRFRKGNVEKNQYLVEKLEYMAKEKQCSVAQLSLAWVSAQGDNIIPIPGTKSLHHLSENIDSLNVVLSERELQILDQLFPYGKAYGERYPAAILRTFNFS